MRSPYTIIIAEDYETQLRSVKKKALRVAGLQKVSRFFGICALTWATVVLLGGFASALRLLDFYFISILLLLEAARLSTTRVFTKLLGRTHFREGRRPEEFLFKDLQYSVASRLDLKGQVASGFCAFVSLALAAVRIGLCGRHPFRSSLHDVRNITPALIAFYVLVIFNAIAALVSGLYRLCARHSSNDGLTWHHNEVFQTAMSLGMPEASDIDIFELAFQKLSNDHMRNIRPVKIKEHNEDLIRYIYYSPNGVERTCEYLKSGDVSKQVVAANLPGFWVAEKRIEKQGALFWALQDRLYGAGKVAEAAANSIQCLGRVWADQHRPHPFLISDPSRIANAPNVVDTLIRLLVEPIRPSLLFQLRALEACCRSNQVLEHIYNQGVGDHDTLRRELQDIIAGNEDAQSSTPKNLCRKLESIVVVEVNSATRQTTRIYAANVLYALLCFNGELEGAAKERVSEMVQVHLDPTKGNQEYLWAYERDMLNSLRNSLQLPVYEHWHDVRIKGDDGTEEPCTLPRPTRTL